MRPLATVSYLALTLLIVLATGYFCLAAADRWEFIAERGAGFLGPPIPSAGTTRHASAMVDFWITAALVNAMAGLAICVSVLVRAFKQSARKSQRGFEVLPCGQPPETPIALQSKRSE